MDANEFLLHQVVLERLGETRADAERRALLGRGRCGRTIGRAWGFAIAAKIVENARARPMNAHRRETCEG